MCLLFWNRLRNKCLLKLTLVSQMASSVAQTAKGEAGREVTGDTERTRTNETLNFLSEY